MSLSLRVLIVEDEAMVAFALEAALVCLGYEVCDIVSTEAEAVAAAKLHRPDIITLDVQLRAGDGIAAAERIRRSEPVAVVFVTGSRGTVEAQLPGAVIVDKPFNPECLRQAIAAALASRPAVGPAA